MKSKLLTMFLLLLTITAFGQGNGLYRFRDKSGKYGFMDQFGTIKIQSQYLLVKDFFDGRAFVAPDTINGSYAWMCIDTTGKKVFNLNGSFPEEDFSEGLARLTNFTEHWFVNTKGEKAFSRTFADGRGSFSNGYALVSDIKFKDFYFIDKKGIRAKFPYQGGIRPFKNGLTSVYDNGEILIDTLGNKVSDRYEWIQIGEGDLIRVRKNNKWGFINRKGKIVIETMYSEAYREPDSAQTSVDFFYDGFAKIQRGGLWGFINEKNEIVVKPQFKTVHAFSEGLAAATLDGKHWGFIDKTGHFVIEAQYYLADGFKNGVSAVRLNYQQFEIASDYFFDAIINRNGEILNKVFMHSYMGFNGDLIEYYEGIHFSGDVFYLDKNGQSITPKTKIK